MACNLPLSVLCYFQIIGVVSDHVCFLLLWEKKFSGCCRFLWGDRIFEKCGIGRDERGDGGKTLEIRGKRRLSARDGGANYQQS